eukprot:6151781-Prymnesium_polylepis.1
MGHKRTDGSLCHRAEIAEGPRSTLLRDSANEADAVKGAFTGYRSPRATWAVTCGLPHRVCPVSRLRAA